MLLAQIWARNSAFLVSVNLSLIVINSSEFFGQNMLIEKRCEEVA